MSEASDSRTEMSSSTTKTTGRTSPGRFASDWPAADELMHAPRGHRVPVLVRRVDATLVLPRLIGRLTLRAFSAPSSWPRSRQQRPRPPTHSPASLARLAVSGGGFAGNQEGKRGARAVVWSCPQPAAMRLDDRTADAKPHAGAVRLRREERVEDLLRDVRLKPDARVTDGNKNLLVLSWLHRDQDLSRAIDVLHRFDAIDEQIHRDLLQLHAIPDDAGKIGRQLRRDRDVVARCFVVQEADDFLKGLRH